MNFELRSGGGARGRRGPAAAGTLLLLALLLLMGLGAALAQRQGFDAAEVRQARDRVLSDSRYQTERPAPQERPKIDFSIPPWLAKTIFWAVVIAVGLVVLFFVVNLILDLTRNRDAFRRRHDPRAEGARRIETPLAESRAADPYSLAEADRLAAEGRFSEAIHLLLLVAMARLHRELGPRIAPAMTGREVLRLPALPGNTVEPLTRMVQLSEINHFGGRRAAEPDYRACRADYLRFNGEPAPA